MTKEDEPEERAAETERKPRPPPADDHDGAVAKPRDTLDAEVDDPDPQGTAETRELEPLAPAKKKRWWLRILLSISILLLLAAGGAAAFVWTHFDEIARSVIVSRAEAHGVHLEFDTLDLVRHGITVESATMGKVKLTTEALPGVDIEADQLEVAISGFSPQSAVLTGLKAKITAAPKVKVSAKKATVVMADFAPVSTQLEKLTLTADDAGALIDLTDLTSSAPFTAVKTTIQGAHLEIKRVAPGLPESLAIDADRIERDGDKTILVGFSTKLPVVGLPIQLARLELSKNKTALSIGVPTYPELTLSIADRGAKIDATLTNVPADLLAEKLGWSRPPNFSLTASASMSLGVAGLSGTYKATLAHYVPPHPMELNGIVFGDATEVTGAFKLDGTKLGLSDIAVTAGALKLKGTGIADTSGAGRAELTLDGSVGCTELAASAVGSHLGLGAGFLTGQIAAGRLTGTVGVHLGVVLDGKDAAHPEVHPSAFLHCGLSLSL